MLIFTWRAAHIHNSTGTVSVDHSYPVASITFSTVKLPIPLLLAQYYDSGVMAAIFCICPFVLLCLWYNKIF